MALCAFLGKHWVVLLDARRVFGDVDCCRAFVKLSIRASTAWASAKPAPITANAAPPRRIVESLIFIGISGVFHFRLKSVRELEHPFAARQRSGAPAVHPLIVALKPQGVSEVVHVANCFTVRSRPETVVHPIKAGDQFDVVNEGKVQIQSRQFVTTLDPPTPRRKGAPVVSLHPGVDILALQLEVGGNVQRGIDNGSRPQPVPFVIPWARLT